MADEEVMEDNQSFVNILRDVIGMSTTQINRLQQEGINSVNDMLLVGEEDVLASNSTGNSKLTAMVKSRLRALIAWGQQLNPLGEIDITLFDDIVCAEWQQRLNQKRIRTAKGSKKDDLKMPDPFSGKQNNWLQCKREMKAYLGQKEGVNGTPLLYVIWTEEDDTITEGQQSDIVNQIKQSPKTGNLYERDNYTVFGILQLWTSGGNAATYVDTFQTTHDGRGAWLYLLNLFDGGDAKETLAREARRMIKESYFSKESRNFSSEDYCNKHIRANNRLIACGQG